MHSTSRHQSSSPQAMLIGRDSELAEIASLLSDPACRLLTLAGPGGIGKTRLAVEIAGRLALEYEHGSHVVELVGVEDPANFPTAVATTLGFQFYDSDDAPQTQLVNYLRNKHLLLVLDNFEHLLAAGDLLDTFLQAAPTVKLLVTSRVVLNLPWEYIYDVPGLRVPHSAEGVDLAGFGAVQLFAERARRVQRHFALERERTCVLRICQMVDGMPLGIELAASWLRMMSCADLTTRLANGLAFLTDRQNRDDARHRSLQAVFEQSWNLLTPAEQEALACLTVFHRGFSWEAAEAVTQASLDVLSALVDQSLVRITADGEYDLHELVRQFAGEKLAADRSAHAAVLDRHAAFFCGWLEHMLPEMLGRGVQDVLAALDANLDNVRAAWEHANQTRQVALVLRADEMLFHYYHFRGLLIEAAGAFGQAASAWSNPSDDTETLLQARLRARLGTLIKLREDPERAEGLLRQALTSLCALGDDRARAFTQTWLANALNERGQMDDSVALAQDSLEIWERLGDHYGTATSSRHLAFTLAHLGRVDDALAWMEKSLATARESGHGYIIGYALFGLGRILRQQTRVDESRRRYQQTIESSLEGGFPDVARHALSDLSEISEGIGDYQLAREAAAQGLALAEQQGDPLRIANLLNRLGWVEYRSGNLDAAERCFTRQRALAIELNIGVGLLNANLNAAIIAAARGRHDEAKRHYESVLAMAREQHHAGFEVTSLVNLGYNAVLREDFAGAVRYSEEALAAPGDFDARQSRMASAHLHRAHGLAGIGDMPAAYTSYLEALRFQWEHHEVPVALETVAGLARVIASRGELERAVELASLARHHAKLHADSRPIPDRLLDELRAELPTEEYEAALGRGRSLDVETVVEAFLDESALALPESASSQGSSDMLAEPLSERELEVLALVSEGKSNRQIAAELYLALGTVKTHVHNICGKLEARNRTEAAAIARELGLF